jgi:hypothetical protein
MGHLFFSKAITSLSSPLDYSKMVFRLYNVNDARLLLLLAVPMPYALITRTNYSIVPCRGPTRCGFEEDVIGGDVIG